MYLKYGNTPRLEMTNCENNCTVIRGYDTQTFCPIFYLMYCDKTQPPFVFIDLFKTEEEANEMRQQIIDAERKGANLIIPEGNRQWDKTLDWAKQEIEKRQERLDELIKQKGEKSNVDKAE